MKAILIVSYSQCLTVTFLVPDGDFLYGALTIETLMAPLCVHFKHTETKTAIKLLHECHF